MRKKNNIINVTQSLVQYYKIPVNNETIERYILNHYLYPSIEVICDAFDEWNIDFEVYQSKKEKLQDINTPFIAHLTGEENKIVFVYSITNKKVIYTDSYKKKKVTALDSFATKCSGLLICVYPDNKSGEKEFKQKKQSRVISKVLIPLSLILLGLALIPSIIKSSQAQNHYDRIAIILMITKIIGLMTSLFIVLKELKIYNKISYKLCTINSKFDCNAILGTPASIFFGWITWGDIGTVYFLSGLLTLLAIPQTIAIYLLFIFSALSVIFPFYSIYYQIVKIKKICPFCMLVQLILILDFIVLFLNHKQNIPSYNEVWQVILIYASIAFLTLLIKIFYSQEKQVKVTQDELMYLKYNPDIFNTILKQKQKLDIPKNHNSFFCENHNSNITITAFLSLTCSACENAFKHLKNLYLKNDDISLELIFSVANKDNIEIINHFHFYLQNKGINEALKALSEWYSKTISKEDWLKKYPIRSSFNIESQIEQLSNSLYQKNYIEQIPTIYINGYLLPNIYDISDINSLLLENVIDK